MRTPSTDEPSAGGRTRIPNAERTRTTRAALLQATIDAIVQYGYRGATLDRIAELSGFTRGAQKHHFGSKARLVTEALVDLHARYVAEWTDELEQAKEKGINATLHALWKALLDEQYIASMELRMAARIDDDLRAALIPAEQEIGRTSRQYIIDALDDGRHSPDRLWEIGEMGVNTLRGMALQRMLYPDEERERRQFRVLEEAIQQLLDESG